jgi:hypothetical protein
MRGGRSEKEDEIVICLPQYRLGEQVEFYDEDSERWYHGIIVGISGGNFVVEYVPQPGDGLLQLATEGWVRQRISATSSNGDQGED